MSRRRAADIRRLRRIAAFAAVPEPQLSALVQASPVIDYAIGERLITQLEPSDFALILLSGAVFVVNESAHGQAPVAHVSAPALIGEIGALARLRRTASVLASTPVRALKIGREALMDVCRHSPDVLVSVIGQLGDRMQSMNHAMGLYAAGFSALERGAFDPAILEDLNHPTAELGAFTAAFQRLARHIHLERRNRDELASAALIQRAMLPQSLGSLPLAGRCDVHAHMIPAREVGGDFYDVFMLDDDHLALAIGDVCGKGVPASLFMSVTMTTLRLAAQTHGSVAETVESANAMLCAQNHALMFATMVYGLLDLREKRFDYVICGHNPPFVLSADGGCVQVPIGGAPLGLVPGQPFESRSIRLAPGDGLFLFTDGVTESVDRTDQPFGETRLARSLSRTRLGATALIDSVLADVESFVGGMEPFDDITCVAVRLL